MYDSATYCAVKRRGRSEVLYFNKFFSENFRPEFTTDALMTKNIFLGTERIVTKQCSKDAREGFAEAGTQSEADQQYYYHADHLGSVSAITDSDGDVYERLEYTPYGEVWIDLQYGTTAFDFDTPYRFTGKELDEETGLYYYGARYLDPRYSVWKSADPALGEYLPVAPVNDDAKKHNQSLPGNGGVFNVVNLNLYHYAGNNPVKYSDPDGRMDCGIYDNHGNYTQNTIQDNNHIYGILIRAPESYSTVNGNNKSARGQDTLIIVNQNLNESVSIPVSSVANMSGSTLSDTLAESDFTLTYDPNSSSQYAPNVFTITSGTLIPEIPLQEGESINSNGTTVSNGVPWRGHDTALWGSMGCIMKCQHLFRQYF